MNKTYNARLSHKDNVTAMLLTQEKGTRQTFRGLAEEMAADPNREQACFEMMEQGPAYDQWDSFDYMNFRKRILGGERVYPTDVIVNISKLIAGYPVEKTMLSMAAKYYDNKLDTSISGKRRLHMLQQLINQDPAVQELPSELLEAMNRLFRM